MCLTNVSMLENQRRPGRILSVWLKKILLFILEGHWFRTNLSVGNLVLPLSQILSNFTIHFHLGSPFAGCCQSYEVIHKNNIKVAFCSLSLANFHVRNCTFFSFQSEELNLFQLSNLLLLVSVADEHGDRFTTELFLVILYQLSV